MRSLNRWKNKIDYDKSFFVKHVDSSNLIKFVAREFELGSVGIS